MTAMNPMSISAMLFLSIADLIVLLVIFRARKKEKRVSPFLIVLLIILTCVLVGIMYPLLNFPE